MEKKNDEVEMTNRPLPLPFRVAICIGARWEAFGLYYLRAEEADIGCWRVLGMLPSGAGIALMIPIMAIKRGESPWVCVRFMVWGCWVAKEADFLGNLRLIYSAVAALSFSALGGVASLLFIAIKHLEVFKH